MHNLWIDLSGDFLYNVAYWSGFPGIPGWNPAFLAKLCLVNKISFF
jgi:hypothetical protein